MPIVAPTPTPTAKPAPAPFADAKLDAAIREALGKAPGEEITAELLAGLTDLNAEDRGITDLSGLEHATNLTTLLLGRNQISDISPLASLTSLTRLELWDNEISDISHMLENSGLGGGDEVWLENNNLDLSEGSEDLENIRLLEARGVVVQT